MTLTRRLAKKVLLIGWDAADWQMIRPLIRQGQMPTLAGLIERGVSGNLATIHPILSPMLWTSIATGKRAHKHGIYGFVEPLPDGSGIRPVNSTSRKTKAIWNILSQNNLTSNVVGWFASHPAEPIRGAVVTDYYLHPETLCGEPSQFPDEICYPSRLKTPLINLRVNPTDLDAQALLPFVPHAARVDLTKDKRLQELASLLARTASIHAVACALMSKEPWDFMAIYYDAIDQFGHHFMPYHPPHVAGISSEDAALYSDVMTGCYRFHDMMLDTLLQQAGPDTTVILVSDHGFHCDERRSGADGFKNPTSWHRQQGIVCLQGPPIKQGEVLQGASLLDVTPTILSLFGIPVGSDMDGRPWLEAFSEETQPKRILSWDDVSGESGCHPPDRQEDTVASAEAIRQLVALGYVDPPSDDIQSTIERTKIDLKTNLAIALTDAGNFEQAIATWQELIALADNDRTLISNYWGEVARCHMQLGHFDECERILNKLLLESPGDAMVLFRLAQLKLRRGTAAAALGQLQLIDGPLADSITYHSLAAPAYFQLRLFDEAKASYRKVLEFDPECAEAWSGLAGISVEQKEFQDACESALQAVGLEHNQPLAHFHLGVALAECGYHSEALKALETCLLLAPRMVAAHQRLAELLVHEGRDLEKANWHRGRVEELTAGHHSSAGASQFNLPSMRHGTR